MATNPKKYSLIIERGAFPERVKDYSMISINNLSASNLKSVDLRNKLPVVYDQGNLGSCTANALCYCFDYIDTTFFPSRLYLYYNERLLDKSINQDAGSTLSQGIIALEKYGICSEKLCPYVISNFKNKPTNDAYIEGSKHTVLSANRVMQTMSSIKGCLNQNLPFVTGIMVYSSFESNEVAKTGYVPMPNTKKEQFLGGHAVTCVGYDDAKSVWIMKNSWGSNWGDRGCFYLPYNYLLSPLLAGDMWQINKVRVMSTQQKIIINKKLEANKHLKKY
jgi:C1A family cysteine protease